MEYVVLSGRDVNHFPAQGCINEFEDVMVRTLGARLVCPQGGENLAILETLEGQPTVAFLVCLTVHQVPQFLAPVRDWRRRFHRVVVYVFDAYEKFSVPRWPRRRFSPGLKTINQVDRIYVALAGAVEHYTAHFAAPVSFLPLAADVLQYGSTREDRCISINAYGRQHAGHSRLLAGHFNDVGRDGLFYHTSHTAIGEVHDYLAHRRQFWKMLSMSRIALAYDPLVVNRPGVNAFPFSFVGQRWFESLAAGCLVVGRRPRCEEAATLLDWPDATVELPEDDAAVLPFMLDLLHDEERLRRAHRENYRQSLLRNDWRHRLACILEQDLGLECPVALVQELKRLEQRAG